MNLIQGPLRDAIYDELDAALSVDVVVQKQTEQQQEPGPPYVMIETPAADPRGDIKTDTGYELTQRIRVHTRYPKGKADLSKREEIAESVHDALQPFPEPAGHNVMPVPPTPSTTPQEYDAGGQQAYDLLLDYSIRTQTL